MNRIAAYKNMAGPITQYNKANQITQAGGAGESVVEGILNELSKVKVNVNGAGLKTAQVRSIIGTNTFRFSRDAEFNEGNNTIAVEATDAQGNQTTKNYTVNIAGSQKGYEHDLNGNLTEIKDASGNLLISYTWDAKNRLLRITEGNKTTVFEYDGSDRRIRIIEKEQGVEMSNETFLWCGESICQKRNSTADLVSRDYYSGGFIEGGVKYYYTKDHLGSIRDIVAENGATVEARYDYTPFGIVSKISGVGVESDFLYTGHYYHVASKLHLTHYRAYDAELGRWLSADPLGESEGYNLYAYVGNDPMNRIDPLGLSWTTSFLEGTLNTMNFVTGAMDAVTFGASTALTNAVSTAAYGEDVTNAVRRQRDCSKSFKGGQIAGTVAAAATGVGALKEGLKQATKQAGKEFSHSLPARYFKQSSKHYKPRLDKYLGKYKDTMLNGNMVSPMRHFKHDPFRYPKGWRGMGNRYRKPFGLLDRIPNSIRKSGLAFGVAGSQAARSGNNCP